MVSSLHKGFRFNGWGVRPLAGEITGHGGACHVHPKVMEVLVCLAERAGDVVRRDEILDRVWGHRYGSDMALTRCISDLRRAIDDRSDDDRQIETIPKRGYRLRARIEPLEVDESEASPEQQSRPSIAVLPFTNLSDDPDQEYFSDGITEDIITELSRIPGLFVIARNSTFTFKDRRETVQRVSRELGARFILEGSVRKAGADIKVTAQLADGINGRQIWAEHYNRKLSDVFAVQDELASRIVSVLAVTLPFDEDEQRIRRVPENMEAYELVLRGRELAWLHKRQTGKEARRLLAHALALDPNYPAAHSWLAFTHLIDYVNQWIDDPDASLRVADELAGRAVSLDETDAQSHFVLGECRLWSGRKHSEAFAHGERAVKLEPNYSHAYLLLGHAMHYSGRSQESLEPYEIAMRLDPFYPDLYLHFLAQSYYSLERFQDAIEALEERLTRNPSTDISHALLAACYGRLGLLEEARTSWASVLRINPGYSLEERRRVLPYEDPADFDDFVEGLRAASLVE